MLTGDDQSSDTGNYSRVGSLTERETNDLSPLTQGLALPALLYLYFSIASSCLLAVDGALTNTCV